MSGTQLGMVLAEFREVTNPLDNKKDFSIKLLKKTVKSLETVLKSIDKFLKSKNIDVGKAYETSRDKLKEKSKSLSEASSKMLEETKQKGLRNVISEKSLNIKSRLESIFAKDKEKASGPPEEVTAEEPEKDKSETSVKSESKTEKLKDKAKSHFQSLQEKVKEKLTPSGSTGEEKQSWLERLNSKQEKRKNEIEEEKKAVKEKAKKKGGGWLGKILSGIMSLGGMVVGGLTKSLNFLGGFLFKGFSKALFSIIPGLSGGIAKGLQSVIGKALAVGGKGALSLAGTAAKAALPFAKAAGGMALRGAAMLATGPVGWAIAAGTAIYAGYKLYKYLTRNDVSSDIFGKLTRLRLLMYGFNDINKEYYSKIFDLEMLMKDYVRFTNYRVEITKLDAKAIEKVLDLFGVSREEKEKYSILNNWFMKRFIPAYKAFLQALYSVNSNIYLDQIDKLKPVDLVNFITKFTIPSNIYNINQIPSTSNPNVLVKKEDVDALYTNICNEIKEKAPKEKTPEEKAKETNQAQANKQTQATTTTTTAKTEKAAPAAQPAPKPVPVAPTPSAKDDKATSGPDVEGEPKPTVKQEINKTAEKATDKLNKASGALTPGGMSLEGISTKLDKTKIYNLDPNVRELFTGMAKEYHALTGKNIPVNEAFRSFEDQAALYKKMPGKAAKPGNSTHEYGLAVDINSDVSQELDKMGLLRKYGFTTSVGGEKWHLEPIGVSLNPTMAKKDVDFRTKAVLSSPGKGGGGYGFLSNSVLKKRDTNYQLSIYNSNSDNPIDVEKVAAETATKEGQKSPTTSVITEANKAAGTSTQTAQTTSVDKTTTPTSEVVKTASSDKTTTTTTTGGDVTIRRREGSSVDAEGETKPSIPKTTTPIVKKEETPSLDTKGTTVPSNQNLDIAKYANLSVEQAIKQAAKMVGVNEQTMMDFAKIESSLNPNAKAKTTSASGLFQITDKTWAELVKKHGSKYGIPADADKNNPFYNSVLAAEYAKENLPRLRGWKEAKIEESTALYLAHHFGVFGANLIFDKINKKPDTPMEETVSPATFKANFNELNNQTAGSYVQAVENKFAKLSGKTFKPKEYAAKSVDSASTPSESTGGMMQANMTTSAPSATNAVQTPKVDTSTKPAIAQAKPSISSSSYSSSVSNTAAREIPVQNSMKDMFSTSKMESILADQLTELSNIAGLLKSIDGKFDLDKLKGLAGGNTTQSPAPLNKNIPSNSIDLSRKKITT